MDFQNDNEDDSEDDGMNTQESEVLLSTPTIQESEVLLSPPTGGGALATNHGDTTQRQHQEEEERQQERESEHRKAGGCHIVTHREEQLSQESEGDEEDASVNLLALPDDNCSYSDEQEDDDDCNTNAKRDDGKTTGTNQDIGLDEHHRNNQQGIRIDQGKSSNSITDNANNHHDQSAVPSNNGDRTKGDNQLWQEQDHNHRQHHRESNDGSSLDCTINKDDYIHSAFDGSQQGNNCFGGKQDNNDDDNNDGHGDDDDDDNDSEMITAYYFQGTKYETYQEMVNAKRKYNQQVLRNSGLLTATIESTKQRAKASAAKIASSTREAGTRATVDGGKQQTAGDDSPTAQKRRKSMRLTTANNNNRIVNDSVPSFANGKDSPTHKEEEHHRHHSKYHSKGIEVEKLHPRSGKVLATYESIRKAIDANEGVTPYKLYSVLDKDKGKRKEVGGFFWRRRCHSSAVVDMDKGECIDTIGKRRRNKTNDNVDLLVDNKKPNKRKCIVKGTKPTRMPGSDQRRVGEGTGKNKMTTKHSLKTIKKTVGNGNEKLLITPQCLPEVSNSETNEARQEIEQVSGSVETGPLPSDEKIQVIWEPSKSFPCDFHLYTEGDVILYSTHQSLEHHEVILPSPRYELHAFVERSKYRRTHHTPEEGFEALILRRNHLATLPWGFSLRRDEFGGACLVDAVDPASFAETAVYLVGADQSRASSGLRVNDMLMAINGKEVGGMTVTGVDIELEISGPEITLIVSRYKNLNQIQNRIQNAEKRYSSALDEAIKGGRQLDCIDDSVDVTGAAYSGPKLDSSDPKTDTLGDVSDTSSSTNQSSHHNIGGEGGMKNGPSDRLVSRDQPIDEESEDCTSIPRSVCLKDSSKTINIVACKNERMDLEETNAKINKYTGTKVGMIQMQDSCSPDLSTSRSIILKTPNKKIRSSSAVPSLEQESHAPSTQDANDESGGGESDSEAQSAAWLGCVCGKVHKKLPVFWIQCEHCTSWFNVNSRCIGFEETEAQAMLSWTCGGCPEPSLDGSTLCDNAQESKEQNSSPQLHQKGRRRSLEVKDDVSVDRSFLDDESQKHKKLDSDDLVVNDTSLCDDVDESKRIGSMPFEDKRIIPGQETDHSSTDTTSSKAGGSTIVGKGSLVYIKEHGWANVNVEAGVARVLDSYIDDDGGLLYDIKYVVGGKQKGVEAEYVKPHRF